MEFSGRTWRPPYERYMPIVEATAGCAWGRCTFCTLFCEERFSVGRLDRFERDLDEVKRFVPQAPLVAHRRESLPDELPAA